MTASSDLRQALEKYLVATPNIPEIAWENQAYQPVTQTPWIQARLILDVSQQIIGVGAPALWEGVLRLTLHYPENKGAADADAFADSLLARFYPGTQIIDGAVRVLCRNADRGRAVNQSSWFVLPLDINWRSYIGE